MASDPHPGRRGLVDLSRNELAVLGREFLLAGQLMDRASMPHIISLFGREVMGEIAIDEWMGASPIYTPRMQKLLNFANGDVETIFKGMQFDIGAPPEFMDFRYKVVDANHGEFWLDHCGALMDVEPMGAEYVTTMCHTIEDPTFDATAIATNRRARMEAIHRPPREPVDRAPHCHWTVTIDENVDPLPDPEPMAAVARTVLARSPVAAPEQRATDSPISPDGDEAGQGAGDYSWPLDPDLRLESFSKPVLIAVLQEIAVQSHLLVMSMIAAIENRSSTETALEIAAKQFLGSAGLTAERIVKALHLGDGVADLAQVIQLHPAFLPRSYVDLGVSGDTQSRLEVSLYPCEALSETGMDNWISLLGSGAAQLSSIAFAVNPSFDLVQTSPLDGAVASWTLLLDDEPGDRRESKEVALTRFSTGAEFEFSVPSVTQVSLPQPRS